MVMESFVFSFKNPWIFSFLIPIFTFACGNSSVFIIITTTIILGGSAFLFLTQSKHNVQVITQEDEFDVLSSDQTDSNQTSIVENKGCLNMGSPDSGSECEVIDPEDSEFDGCRRSSCSEGSISDEESLIEIELFGGNYVGYKDKDEEEPKMCRRKKSPDSVLWWPEMNEEENMIEIDLSVGSIKCSRMEMEMEIKARVICDE